MRRNTFCYAVLLIAGTVLAGAAVGQDKPAQDRQAQGKQAQDKQAPQAKPERQQGSAAGGATREAPVAGAVPLELTIEQKTLLLKGWRASKLIGASVYNDQNKRIGKHRVAIPVDDFADIKAKKLVLPGATKEALKALPEFHYA